MFVASESPSRKGVGGRYAGSDAHGNIDTDINEGVTISRSPYLACKDVNVVVPRKIPWDPCQFCHDLCGRFEGAIDHPIQWDYQKDHV
jgi:hypothetical protein